MTPAADTRLGRTCSRCGAPELPIEDLAAIATRIDAHLTRSDTRAFDLEAVAGIRLLASTLPCVAGVCRRAGVDGTVQAGPATVTP